jgi:hypothetical protein
MLQQVRGSVAQVIRSTADFSFRFAVASADGVTDFFAAAGRKQQSDCAAQAGTRDENA